jgi:cytochrome b
MAKRDRTFVWDWPTRLFHWLLVILLGVSWWSAESDGPDSMQWHYLAGYTILALLLFRLIWGFVGTSTARFAEFLRGPGKVLAYLRGAVPETPGHNPLGGWSVALMLALLLVQVGLGLVAVDVDGIEAGPLSYLVSFDMARAAAELHELVFKGLQIVVAIHVLAILWYQLVKRTNLVGPMIGGYRDRSGAGGEASTVPFWRLPVAILAGAAVAWFVAQGLRLT